MGDYDLYRSRISAYGNTIKEGNTNATLNFINNTFEDSPSYFEVSINGSEQLVGVRITDNSTNSASKVDYIRKIIMKPSDSISVGDIVDWDSKKWLVTSAEKFSDLYWYGMIQETNNTLKYYKNGILFEVPYVVFDSVSLTRMGTNDSKYLSIPNSKMMIETSDNEIARLIKRNDIFTLYNKDNVKDNYEVIDINRVRSPGLIILELQWTESEPLVPTHNYTIEILNGAEQIVKYGETLILNIQVKDNGVLVSPTPSLLFESSNGTICTVNQDGAITATNDSGSAIVTVRLASDTNISSNIEIDVSPASQTNYIYTLVGNIQSDTQLNFNQTKTYTATKLDNNNNNIISSQFLFQIVGDVPSDKYILTVLNDNQCSLKCMGYPYTITLRAIDINNSQYIDKIISFKSLM